MGIFSFGEFCRYNGIDVNSPENMKYALERYTHAADRVDLEVWAIDMAAKYFEEPEEYSVYTKEGTRYRYAGWEYHSDSDGDHLQQYTEVTAPGFQFQWNPWTRDLWCNSDDADRILYEWYQVDDPDGLLRWLHIPGYNHGWDEESVKKEIRYTDLHNWAIAAEQEDFENEKTYVRAVLDREYLKEHPEWGKAGLWLLEMLEKKVFWLENLSKFCHLCPDKGPFGILNATCGNYHLKISHYGFVMAYCGKTIATYWARTRVLEVRDKLTKHKGAIKGLCMDLVRKYNF